MSQRITKVLGLIALTGLTSLISAQTLNWAPAGPVYNAGRARNMVVSSTDYNTLYVGSASSGIFKSTNAGVTWGPINDQASVRNISYMAQSSDGTIWVGTGEGFLRAGQKLKAQPGTGLYKLDESLTTPTLNLVVSSAVVGTVINRVACNPNNSTHIALATNKGIFVSTNGSTFNQATLPGAPTGSLISGQDVKFDSNGILYCTIGAETGTASAATASKVYKASDASFSSFAEKTPTSSILPDNFHGRIELAVAPSDNNIIYASVANKYNGPSTATLKGLFVSYDAGQTWALITQGAAQLDPLSNGGTLASGDYAHVITVNPSNPHQIFIAGYSFYIFTRTNGSTTSPLGEWVGLGQSFFQGLQSYLHQNIHDIKFVPNNPAAFYFVTDAGVFRSIDLAPLLGNLYTSINNQGKTVSFQPFYKGLITGQFNSVSIERYPIGASVGSTVAGTPVSPYSGFIGGTGGNGLTYFSGTYSLVTTELNYIGGEVYNAEYSKILPNAAFASIGNGSMFRSSNVKTSNPTLVNVNKYTSSLSRISPEANPLTNTAASAAGTAFRLWEDYGQTTSPDSAVFYNDTTRYQASMTGVQELTTKTTFTFATSRPNKFALIDSVVVRTGTVQLPITGTYSNLQTPFTSGDRQTIYASILPKTFTANSTATTLTSNSTGPVSGALSVSLNPSTLVDNISVTFSAPPFASKTIPQYPWPTTSTVVNIPDPAVYYRVFATVYYKYKVGDEVTVVDNNISTRTNSYTATLTRDLNWRYGSGAALGSYTISAATSTAVTNPTYVINPSSAGGPQSSPVFTVTPPPGSYSYTLSTLGTYSLNAPAVSHTITANTDINIPGPYVYSISPGNYTQTSDVFTVSPIGTVDYTMTQTSPNSTLTNVSNSVVGTSTYVLTQTISPAGSITQTNSTMFVVSPTISTTYTLQGLSADPLTGANTQTTIVALALNTVVPAGDVNAPMAPNNKPFKMPAYLSARLAMILNNSENTGGVDAIVVSKNPLALNDPLSVVRVSQTGTYSDDASGNPTTNTIAISGRPTLLEWSKSGTEIYFATNANKLYRVSHITSIMDLSPSSYSGKFYTDVFKYNAPINNATINPVSPYRTTLIGSFDRPITSISVSNDNKSLAVTFNTSNTGTTSTVIYNTNDARLSNETNIGWVSKQGTFPGSITITYCSLMEKGNNKMVFIGTDNGMYFTSDITASSPNWDNVNANSSSKLPNVQIFDIKQQTFGPSDCYNSGQIYVATNGRGVWTNGNFFSPYMVGIDEYQKPVEGKNMSIYPNPTNGNVTVAFNSVDGETAVIQVMDISGRVVQSEELGKLNAGEINHSFTTSALNSGVYIVNISSNSGVKRVTKLVVTK